MLATFPIRRGHLVLDVGPGPGLLLHSGVDLEKVGSVALDLELKNCLLLDVIDLILSNDSERLSSELWFDTS